jgi:D-3-phosphoglycerate dehydrogenase
MTLTAVAIDHRFGDLAIERDELMPYGIELLDAAGLPPGEALARCAEADGVLVGARLRLDAGAIAGLHRCRVIARYGVGVDNVDVDAATAAGIWVTFVPDYCIEEVADHAIAMLLAVSRRLTLFDAAVRADHWGIPPALGVRRLSIQTLGVVGFGRIGQAVAHRARALGLRVLAADPALDDAAIRAAGAEPLELDALLAASDFVSLHAPPARDGTPLLDARRLALLPEGACVINVARGGLIDEPALIAALRSGALSGAGLDVAAAEPLRASDPLLEAPGLLVSPHSAWYSLDAVRELRAKTAAEVARVLVDGHPRNPANRPVSVV